MGLRHGCFTIAGTPLLRLTRYEEFLIQDDQMSPANLLLPAVNLLLERLHFEHPLAWGESAWMQVYGLPPRFFGPR